MIKIGIIIIMLAFSCLFSFSFAEEPILITISNIGDKIVFDGKWTDQFEWKEASYNMIQFEDGKKIVLRTAHQDDFIYVQVNSITDRYLDKKADSAIVCFDTKNDKTVLPQNDDYCFFTTLEGKSSFTFQGGSLFATNEYFKKIPNHVDFVAIGGVTDRNDRYTNTPHPNFEFKIPLDVLGRSDNYGFYFSIYEAKSQQHYSWPQMIETKSTITIPSPQKWGDIVSPDKSLPEFNFSILFLAIIPLIILSSIIRRNSKFLLK